MATASKTRSIGWSGLAGLLALSINGVSGGAVDAKTFKSKKGLVIASASSQGVTTASHNSHDPSPQFRSRNASVPVRFFTINQVLAKLDNEAQPVTVARFASNTANAEATLDVSPQPAAIQHFHAIEPFGLATFRAPEGALWVKWRAVQAEVESDLTVLQDCRDTGQGCASAPAMRLISIVDQARAQHGRARIETINRAINSSIRYVSDLQQHGSLDHWSAPLTTFAAGRGDCEDYAIAKYVALRLAGVATDDLRLLLVRDRVAGDHAVLGVRDGERWLILDNRHLVIHDSETLPHFTPLFALDHQGVKLFAAPYASRKPLPQQSAPAAKQDDEVPRPIATIAARDAGLGDWRALPLAL
jgi:predicted transglutaminase-like cysteine proteinase